MQTATLWVVLSVGITNLANFTNLLQFVSTEIIQISNLVNLYMYGIAGNLYIEIIK